MDLLQTIAFLQWLTDEQPMTTWRQEELDFNAWIETNGFDPGVVLAGIEDLERRNEIPSGFAVLASGTASLDLQKTWVGSTRKFLAKQNALNQISGGTGSTLGQIKRDYRKSLININNHTDQEISKEIQSRIDERIENRVVDKLDTDFPKYADAWGTGLKIAQQDYTNKAISQHQKEILAAHGVTTNKWFYYGMEGYTKGFQVNYKGGYISIEYNDVYGYQILGENPNQTYEILWDGRAIPKTWSQLVDLTFCNIELFNNSGGSKGSWSLWAATNLLHQEQILAKDAHETISSPYVKLSLKYTFGEKRYNNFLSIYEVLSYLQEAKFQQFSPKNKIFFTLGMIYLDYDLLEQKFSKYRHLFKASKIVLDAFNTPDKIYQAAFAAWVYRNLNFEVDDNFAYDYNQHGIEVTNKKSGADYLLIESKDGTHLEVGYENSGYVWLFPYSTIQKITQNRLIIDANKEKQSKVFEQLQQTWLKEKILYANIKHAVDNPVLDRILKHEARRYDILSQIKRLGKIKILWQQESKTLPWLAQITPKSLLMLLVRLNSVSFRELSTLQKTILLLDLSYIQNQLKPFKETYLIYSTIKNQTFTVENKSLTIGGWLNELNKGSINLVAIAWNQIVAGTYRTQLSPLPLYQQYINRFLIERVASQDPRIVVANKSELNIEGTNIDISISKEPIFSSTNKDKQKSIYDLTLTDGKGTRSFLYPTQYTPHQFALNCERKWFKSNQEQWAKQAYTQIQAFDVWYQQITSFPLIKKLLRHDFIHSQYWNVQIGNKTLLFLYNNDLIRELPSQHAIYSALRLLAEINENGLDKKQKRWLRKQSDSLQLSIFFDIVAIRTSLAIFVRHQRSLIDQLSKTAQALEKVSPDKIYQRSIKDYFDKQYNDSNFEFDRFYRVPGTDVKIEVINGDEYSVDGVYDVVITNPNANADSRGYTSLFVSKQSEGWVVNWIERDRIFDINQINKSRLASQIIDAWSHSKTGNAIKAHFDKLRAFYLHTTWLLSLAFIPIYARKNVNYLNDFKSNHQFAYKYRSKISHDFNYFFTLNFKGLSKRKKVILITDYYLFAAFEEPSLRQLITGRRQASGKAPIEIVYQHLSSLAKASMQITPAKIYQREFVDIFGLNKWSQDWKKNNDQIEVFKEVSTNGTDYINVEIYTPNIHRSNDTTSTDLIVAKDGEGWVIESPDYTYNLYDYTDYGIKIQISPAKYFQFTYTPAPWQVNRQLTISGQWKGSISINTNKQTTNLPSIKDVIDKESAIKSLAFLMGFLQNSLVKRMVDTYVRRHHKLNKLVKLLPSQNHIKNTFSWASSINFKALTRKEKIVLQLEYYRIAYAVSSHYQHISRQERAFLEQDIRLLIDLSDILQAHKVTPGTHGQIDRDFNTYGKRYALDDAMSRIREYIYDIRHPKPHKRPWKKWKTWNERVDALINLDRVFLVLAEIEKEFYTIEQNALLAAYKTYQTDLKAGDSKAESIKYADRAYVSSIINQDKILWNNYLRTKKIIANAPWKDKYDFWYNQFNIKTPKGWSEEKTVTVADAKAEQLEKDSIEDIYYREVITGKKLFHIQNDRYLRKLRLEDFLLKQILADKIANTYIQNYHALYNAEQKLKKRGHVFRFFADLGLFVWDLVKTPYVMVATTWKDIVNGDGFFKSWDAGLGAGFKEIKKSLNYLAKDFRDLFFLVDGLLLDIAWLGNHSIFFWANDLPWLKKVDTDILKSCFYVEMGAVFIAKSLLEIPLNLGKDVNKIAKGLVLLAEGKTTLKKMLKDDLEPIFHTVKRLGKFLDHIFTDPKIIKHKIDHVEKLLHLLKLKHEAKLVLRIDRFDRHTRRRLHHQTFGIIKSPFEKFKQRHKGLYYSLKLTNKEYIESGYFTTHPDAAIAEDQLDAIYRAQVRLNGLSHETDFQRASLSLIHI